MIMRTFCALAVLAIPFGATLQAEDKPEIRPEVKAEAKAEKDDAVNVTTFTLKDGTKIQGTSWSSLGDKDLKSYLINTLEGRRMIVLEKELQGKADEVVALEKLPEKARAEVLKTRAAAAAARAEMEAAEKDEAAVAAQRRLEISKRKALNLALDEIALARTVLSNADQIVRNAPIEIARLDAQYDAAKTELGGSRDYVSGYLGGGYRDSRRSDYLRDQMVSAAEEKARVERNKKDAQDVITRTSETLKQLETKAVELRKELDAAEAETKLALKKAREAAQERAQERIKEQQQKDQQKKDAAQKDPANLEIRPASAPAKDLTVLVLKDGTRVKATTILEDPDGRITIKDDQGKILYVDAKDVQKRE
ncbi:MAG TPA: hypothetical protein VEJ63_18300 [Planctomycetota bacterium]|nr:hypothetical protein [Planctomycetota bacterium]